MQFDLIEFMDCQGSGRGLRLPQIFRSPHFCSIVRSPQRIESPPEHTNILNVPQLNEQRSSSFPEHVGHHGWPTENYLSFERFKTAIKHILKVGYKGISLHNFATKTTLELVSIQHQDTTYKIAFIKVVLKVALSGFSFLYQVL